MVLLKWTIYFPQVQASSTADPHSTLSKFHFTTCLSILDQDLKGQYLIKPSHDSAQIVASGELKPWTFAYQAEGDGLDFDRVRFIAAARMRESLLEWDKLVPKEKGQARKEAWMRKRNLSCWRLTPGVGKGGDLVDCAS